MEPKRNQISWQHIVSLEDWVVLEVLPALVTESYGPLGWVKSGQPSTLQAALCSCGLESCTAQELTELVLHLGAQLESGKCSKMSLMEQLIDMCLPDGAAKQAAFERVRNLSKKKSAAAAADDEIDSQFSEILSELDKEEGNQQDILEFKQKKRMLHAKRKVAARDKPLEKKKGKGKGRGKGKGKQKKATQAKSFFKRFAQKKKGKTDTPQADVEMPEAPHSAAPANSDVEMQHAPSAPGVEMPEAPQDAPAAFQMPWEGSEQPSAEPSASSSSRAGFKKVNRSPGEILSQISPPNCVIGLAATDWRFTSTYKQGSEIPSPYCQKTMSATFCHGKRPW